MKRMMGTTQPVLSASRPASEHNFGVQMAPSTMANTFNNNNGQIAGVTSINDIVKGIQSDLKSLKTQMESLPPFPKGK